MQLWTDYEGVTIDGAYPLQKLLMPEGRSAFYSTAGTNGEPTVVRLIECHFDEEEILARWRCVQALSHPNFLKFEHFGQTELEGRPVVYAVLEKVDANLAEVLDRGSLTVEDVAQLASSLVAALEVLHTHGFIHEHIEPRNIFAIGDVVKLRSDCIREAPEGEEGRVAKQRDVHDLAAVLLQGLTQRESIENLPDSALPPPFAWIIRNGLNGTWGLENIRTALERRISSKPPSTPESVNAALAARTVAERKAPDAVANPSTRPKAQLSLPLLNEDRNAGFGRATRRSDTWGDDRDSSLRSRWIGIAGIVAVLILLFTWVIAHAWNAHRHEPTQTAAVSPSAAQPATQIPASPAPQPIAADLPRVSLPASAGARANWRVIAFTYNRRTDAENKVSGIARSHPELQPAVFTPSGRAPYLVSIGGVMDRDAAYALARRSRSQGLPRDSYARNYSR
jgi:hypothetical protein